MEVNHFGYQKTNKKTNPKHGESCFADAGEVKDAMLLNALEVGDDEYDAVDLNPGRANQVHGRDNVNISQQTDLELGALEDADGLNPANDQQFLHEMKDKTKKNEK